MLDQAVGRGCVARVDRHADAAGDEKLIGAEQDRLRHRIHQALHDVFR
jgi:hypothetical protein